MKYVFNILVITINILILANALDSGNIYTYIRYHINTLLIGFALGTTAVFMINDTTRGR